MAWSGLLSQDLLAVWTVLLNMVALRKMRFPIFQEEFLITSFILAMAFLEGAFILMSLNTIVVKDCFTPELMVFTLNLEFVKEIHEELAWALEAVLSTSIRAVSVLLLPVEEAFSASDFSAS